MTINLIYGTETGYTEIIGEDIMERWLRAWPQDDFKLIRVDETTPEDWKADLLILGAPTWCEPRLEVLGEMSEDWNGEYDDFKKRDFTGQKVAIYGLGDQHGYDDNFVDGIGLLAKPIIENGGTIIATTSAVEYSFISSYGLKDESTFYGLAIDEDNEANRTNDRIINWLHAIERELYDGNRA